MKHLAKVLKINPFENENAISDLKKEVELYQTKHKKTCEMAARAILYALDLKDHYTFNHSTRVAFYSLILGKEIGLTPQELYDLELTALFHDIGKIGIPDSILLKESRLDNDEFEIMKTHPVKTAEILSNFEDFEKIAIDAKYHHERFDGKGYPDGLKGENIPYFSRIILIGDTFDAMTSSRPYRKGLALAIAFEELLEFSGTQFDPHLVKYFLKAMEKEEKSLDTKFKLEIIGSSFDKKAA